MQKSSAQMAEIFYENFISKLTDRIVSEISPGSLMAQVAVSDILKEHLLAVYIGHTQAEYESLSANYHNLNGTYDQHVQRALANTIVHNTPSIKILTMPGANPYETDTVGVCIVANIEVGKKGTL